jgi:putative acetyltransferase
MTSPHCPAMLPTLQVGHFYFAQRRTFQLGCNMCVPKRDCGPSPLPSLTAAERDFADINVGDIASAKLPLNWGKSMDFCSGYVTREQAIFELFTATFSASEGAGEGQAIGDLVRNLMKTTPSKDLLVRSAYDDQVFLGCLFLSRLTFAQDDRRVFILSPVAVKTDRQKNGIGQKLIAYGLDDLRQKGIDFVVTYGDPNYYSKTGFRQITEEFA